MSKNNRLISGSSGNTLKIWSTMSVSDQLHSDEMATRAASGLTMEDEMNLDGAITSAAFDETMDMV